MYRVRSSRVVIGMIIISSPLSGEPTTQTVVRAAVNKAASSSLLLPPQAVVVTSDSCHIPGMHGTYPREIGVSMQEFKSMSHNVASRSVLPKRNANRMLLYGPSGMGKSALAKKFAQLTGSDYKQIEASTVVNTFQNSGAVGVETILADIKTCVDSTRGTKVIFFDEIDALATPRSDNGNASHIDTERAMQRLWVGLSEYEREPRVFFLFATNNIDRLPKPFLNRFASRKVVKIDLPTTEQRKNLLKGFLVHDSIPCLNRAEADNYARDVAHICSGRFTDYLPHNNAIQQSLALIDEHMMQGSKANRGLIANSIKNLEGARQELLNKCTRDSQIPPSARGLTKEHKDVIHEYCSFASSYLETIKKALQKPAVVVKEDHLNNLAAKTEGLSVRALISITDVLGEALCNDTVTAQQIDEVIAQEREKLRLEEIENKRKTREERTKELQLSELELRNKQQQTEQRIKDLQLEEMEDKKKQRKLEAMAAYLRTIGDLRTFFNDTASNSVFGEWGFFGWFGAHQQKQIAAILKTLNVSEDKIKLITTQMHASIKVILDELHARGQELEKNK